MSERFEIGQRVRMTAAGLRQGLGGKAAKEGRPVLGTVAAEHPFMPDCIVVRRDGIKQAERYHRDFWESVSPDSAVVPE